MLPKRIFGTQTQVSPRLWILESTFRNMCFFSWTFFLSQFLSKCSGLTISFMQGKYRNIHANNFSASARPWSARWPADLNEGNGAEVLTMSGLFYVGFLHLQSLLCKSLHIISSRITTNQGCMYVYMYVYIYILKESSGHTSYSHGSIWPDWLHISSLLGLALQTWSLIEHLDLCTPLSWFLALGKKSCTWASWKHWAISRMVVISIAWRHFGVYQQESGVSLLFCLHCLEI